MAMPHGVVIKTPPPQFSTLWHSPTIDESIQAEKSEKYATKQLDVDIVHDFPRLSDDLGPLGGVAFVRHNLNCSITPIASSAQQLRDGCPSNIFLTMLYEYHKLPEYRELPEST